MTELEAIRARCEAATPGPWRWRGNTDHGPDHGMVHLEGRGLDVMGLLAVERKLTDRAARRTEEAFWEFEAEDDDRDEDYEPTEQGKERAAEFVRQWYLDDGNYEPRKDLHLAFVDPESHCYEPAQDLVVYEVARSQSLPDETPRDHPKVYRGDIVDIRNANARFIAAARTDVAHLLAEVDRLAMLVALHEACAPATDDLAARQRERAEEAEATIQRVRVAFDLTEPDVCGEAVSVDGHGQPGCVSCKVAAALRGESQ